MVNDEPDKSFTIHNSQFTIHHSSLTIMKLLLAFTPFHTPASPPFGLACLKGELARARPDVAVKTVDWNLAFFRRWLTGAMPDLCRHHPTNLLGAVCPWLLVQNGAGQALLKALTRLPQTPAGQDAYMQAAQSLDELYNRLAHLYHDLLFPFVEGRQSLSEAAVNDIFGAELADIEAEQPDVVGFSILTEQNLLYALALGKVIKQRFNIPLAFGGAMMSHLKARELLGAFRRLDFVFFGEAEGSIVDFVDAWENGNFNSVGGLAFRRGKKIAEHQPTRPLNIAQLPPPDFSDFPLRHYLSPAPVLPIITSRGCYWGKCAFCSHTRPYGPAVRIRKPDAVIDEMAHHIKTTGARHFLFVDEAISPNMLRRLSKAIIKRGLDVRFGTEGIRVERGFDEPLLALAHRAGLRWLYVGIESGTQRLLNLIDKGIDIAEVERFIERCHRVGIVPQLSFIIGLPSTTPAELQNEISFLKRYPMDSSSFVLLLGSPMYDRPADFGLRIEDQQVLYRTKFGDVHAPRFHFSIEAGLSPAEADAMVEAAGGRRKMRPHLGEVHATLLADTNFFRTETRPPTPPSGADVALKTLSRQRQAATGVDARWFLHMLGALESLGRLEEAFTIAQAGLAAHGKTPATRAAFLLHLATILNYGNQPEQVLRLLNSIKGQAAPLPALRGERARALFALNRHRDALAELRAMPANGYEIQWAYYIQGLCFETLGRYEKALKSFEIAEKRQWYEPEINDAKARCLAALHRNAEAEAEQAKAARKRRCSG